ncbi:MAG: glycogen synthase GlgA [Chloroherpetonaceae bacterium]|nr:glycogen synthase GlgA [Chthonomonadaceae bacterium]MDW8206585.1 glycogen synthase GlgA [Chloroherpetonaceae bacterium]
MTTRKLNILLLSSEVAPFAKVGGLADVAGSLPKALRALGHDVRVAMPSYAMVESHPAYAVSDLLSCFPVPVRPGLTEQGYLKRTHILVHAIHAEVPVYLIGHHGPNGERSGYFHRATESRKIYALEPEPYVFFCRAVLEALRHMASEWKPDIIHCNDWQTGLIPVYKRLFYSEVPDLADAASVFTVHNLAYQGNFEVSQWPTNGLPFELFHIDGLEFYGQWTFMKGGLLFAERVNTVSPNYAREIQTEEYGCGLHGLLRTLSSQGRLVGILNGIDTEEFNPATDPRIAAHYDADNPQGKAQCKARLQAELGLTLSEETALIGMVSRLADQKGLDIIQAIIETALQELPVQFVLLGTGDQAYEEYFTALQARYPEQVHARIAFDAELAQRIYSGSDLFLMPSRFEPCGLGQMIALRYGTLPIVRATGGLADTVTDIDPVNPQTGNGFVFDAYRPEALLATLRRAVTVYQQKPVWQSLVRRAMREDFSWDRSARSYVALYEEALQVRRETAR